MRILLLAFFSCWAYSNISAQQLNGRIINSVNHNAIPFVNISIKNTYLGTVSDADGKYQLKVPMQYANATVCFSCIGYDSREVSVSQLLKNGDIVLTPADVQLGEVTIMPDSTLRSFLRKAYEKIPENYPFYPTQYEAFYREGLQNNKRQYIRLVEAITKANKSSYKNAQSGTVQLIESRKYIDADSGQTFPISFYGGPHFIHELDCVKERYSFIKPHKDYEYTYEGLTKYNDEQVHQISFQPKAGSKKSFKGTMFIHVSTLSYLRFDLQLTDQGLERRFDSPIKTSYGLRSLSKTYVVNYQLRDSVCFLKSIFENEQIETKTGNIFYSPLEMVITKSKTSNVAAIPYNCQIQLAYVPDREATDYFQSDWKDYNTLAQIEVVDTLTTKHIFENKHRQMKKKDQLLDFFRRLDISYKIAYEPYHLSSGLRHLTYRDVSYERKLNNAGTTLALDMSIAYNLSQQMNIGYIIEMGLSDSNLQEKHGPQISYKLPLKTMGNNLFLEPQLAYVWHKYGRSIGVQNFDMEFSFGGKNFKNSKIEALPSIRHHGLQTGSSLLYQLSSMLYLDVNVNYYIPSDIDDVLYLKERSGFFLTRKTANELLSETEAVLTIDGKQTYQSGANYDNWSVSVGVRLMF